ncbi:MAG TPA: nuclear transport factor 2 family protein [Gemmatimonadaceae bacterium]|jgi:hypothetical protein|nr:nuclear transport factor 2 family protein [Gemmatimonadaceae bacterium]
MRRFALLATFMLLCGADSFARAQSAEEQDVLKPIRRLFDGMRKADTAMVRSAFHPDVSFMSTGVRNGETVVRKESLDAFVKVIGTPRPEMLDERVWNEKALIDGPLASVWMDYALFIGPRFSHCGVDAFQLAKMSDGWKIIAIADTRRTEGCKQGPN